MAGNCSQDVQQIQVSKWLKDHERLLYFEFMTAVRFFLCSQQPYNSHVQKGCYFETTRPNLAVSS